MKALLLVATLTATLLSLPVCAQQGPAGVPGAPGLAPPPPPAPVVVVPEPAPGKASQLTPAACRQAKAGKSGQPCKPAKKKSPASCSTAADPARCEQHRKTRELCRKVPESEYRQCLRDNLDAPK